MKKQLMILTATLGLAVSVFGQGQVTLGNNSSSLIRINDAVAGTPAAIGQLTFELLAGAPGGSLTAVGTAPSNGAIAGRIANTVFNITAVGAGQNADFQVRAWDSAFANYATAFGAGALTGQSVVFQSLTSAAGDPPALPVALAGKYPGFAVAVPEPSTIALGLIGAGSLLFLRRKK